MKENKSSPAGVILGAAFLMATSAIGPGFLTQTAQFTSDLLTSFGFVILISLLLDIGAQLNIWRIISVTRLRAQDLANRLLPGLGPFLAGLIIFGGLVFNIGNIAGCGLGLNALAGIDPKLGAIISCGIAFFIFWYREAGKLIDGFVKILGILMILFTGYIAISSRPPVGEALYRTVWPERIDVLKIITLVGGTWAAIFLLRVPTGCWMPVSMAKKIYPGNPERRHGYRDHIAYAVHTFFCCAGCCMAWGTAQ